MSHASHIPISQSAHSFAHSRRAPPSTSPATLSFPQSATTHHLAGHGGHVRGSRTWTASSGEFGLLSDTDEVDDRGAYVLEYNRLAKKHGVRPLILEDFISKQRDGSRSPEKRGWFLRMLRASSSNTHPIPPRQRTPPRPPSQHKRNISDLAHNLVHTRREPLTNIDIQAMVRLSGKSVLYLPPEYAPCALVLPTCIRATAQYLAQNITTRGIFRIPGSVKIVNALFDYYCYEDGSANISSTVRCANLPMHIRSSVHDIASTFKRMLSILDGGILGSLAVFDALVAINSQLSRDPEFPRTKRTKVRARLIALAVGTIQSQFRRELICAVFGLLSLIGRVAEVTPREDEDGRPLPTADLMGYSALGIVFGPLLVGDLLSQYTMKIVAPSSGLLLFPITPQKRRRERRRSKTAELRPSTNTTVDKVLVANDITEMLIANWRDIVRQMKALGIHHQKGGSSMPPQLDSSRPSVSEARPSVSEDFVIRKPQDWSQARVRRSRDQNRHDASPEPETPTLGLNRQGPRSRKSASSSKLGVRPSMNALSPMVEESVADDEALRMTMDEAAYAKPDVQRYDMRWLKRDGNKVFEDPSSDPRFTGDSERSTMRSPRVPLGDVPPRTSSKLRQHHLSSASRHRGPSLLREQITPHRTNREPESPDSARGRRGTRPSQSSMAESRGRSIRSTSRTLKSTRSSNAVRRQPSPARTPSFTEARRTVEERLSVPRYSVEPDEAGELSPMLQDFEKGGQLKNDTPFRRRSTARSPSPRAEPSRVARYEDDDYFYPAKNGSILVDAEIPEPSTELSIEITPRHFYSPMRVPPSLSGEPGLEPASSSSQTDEQLSRDKRSSKGQGLSEQRLRQFDEPYNGALPRASVASGLGQSGTRIVRPSVSKAAKQRETVKSMAAKLEGKESFNQGSPSRPHLGSRDQSFMSSRSLSQGVKSLRGSRSGPVCTPQSQRQSLAEQSRRSSLVTVTAPGPEDDAARVQLRASVSDSAALRAATFKGEERQRQDSSPEKPPVFSPRRAVAEKREPEQAAERPQEPILGSLGTMTLPLEQPLIAQHLNLARPLSSASVISAIGPTDGHGSTLSLSGSSTTARPGSTSCLHSQIRSLQRQLQVKTEEAIQLRRQLEAQQGSDIGTLSEQLREAKREVAIWKDRAEAAERRVKVFERFTARLRGIREAAVVADREDAGLLDPESEESREPEAGYFDEDQISPSQHVRFDSVQRSEDSGLTEKSALLRARIRTCLHTGPDGHDGAGGSFGGDGAASPRRVASESLKEVWRVAEELLMLAEMDDA